LREIDAAFKSRGGDVMKMAEIYAYALWRAWQTAARDGRYTNDVKEVNIKAQEAQVCLRNALKAGTFKDDLEDTYLTVIQSILASDLKTFKKYFFADTLASNHAVLVEARPEIACEHAGVGFLGKRSVVK
jgi:hypothetical protein